MPSPEKTTYTSEDYWNLQKTERAELIHGQLYAIAPPDYKHQKLVSEFNQIIGNYIKAHPDKYKVIPAPFQSIWMPTMKIG